MGKYETYLITRFNLNLHLKNERKKDFEDCNYIINEEYLLKRIELFKQFTYPSVRAQTSQNFNWLVLFSDKTPERIRLIIAEFEKEYRNFNPLFLTDEEGMHLNEFLSAYLSKIDRNGLITIRLDNDDAIFNAYVSQIQSYVDKNEVQDCAISFGYGINFYLKYNVIKTRYSENNHFFAMVATENSKYKHPYAINHINLSSLLKTYIIGSKKYPAWMEVIHDTNYANGDFGRTLVDSIRTNYHIAMPENIMVV